jgi:hypothetical protein
MIDNPGRFDMYSPRYDAYELREQLNPRSGAHPTNVLESQQDRVKLMNQIKQWSTY